MSFFERKKVVLLKSFDRNEEDDNYYPSGCHVDVFLTPANSFYLTGDDGRVFYTDAIEGIDFDFV